MITDKTLLAVFLFFFRCTCRNENFVVEVTPSLRPIAINQIHSWLLTIHPNEGSTEKDLQISVSGGMPLHDHGMQPVTERRGAGMILAQRCRHDVVAEEALQSRTTPRHAQPDPPSAKRASFRAADRAPPPSQASATLSRPPAAR